MDVRGEKHFYIRRGACVSLCCCGKTHKENVKVLTGFYKLSMGIHSEFVVLVVLKFAKENTMNIMKTRNGLFA